MFSTDKQDVSIRDHWKCYTTSTDALLVCLAIHRKLPALSRWPKDFLRDLSSYVLDNNRAFETFVNCYKKCVSNDVLWKKLDFLTIGSVVSLILVCLFCFGLIARKGGCSAKPKEIKFRFFCFRFVAGGPIRDCCTSNDHSLAMKIMSSNSHPTFNGGLESLNVRCRPNHSVQTQIKRRRRPKREVNKKIICDPSSLMCLLSLLSMTNRLIFRRDLATYAKIP